MGFRWLVLTVPLVVACQSSVAEVAEPVAAPRVEPVDGPTTISMRDVEIVQPDGLMRIRRLVGTIHSTVEGQLPMIDVPESYTIAVEHAEVAIDVATLTGMMSQDHTKSGKKSPLASAEFSTRDGHLVVTGKKPVPYELTGDVSIDDEGRMTITLVKLEAFGINTRGLRKVADLHLEDLIDVSNERGVSVEGDVIHVDPLVNTPDPKVIAVVTGVSVEDGGLVLRLGDEPVATPEVPTSTTIDGTATTEGTISNFVIFEGGRVEVRRGALTMGATSVHLVDHDPSDPFRMATDARMTDQLVASTLRIAADGGVTIEMPDSDELGVAAAAP